MQAKARRTGFACKKPEFSRFFEEKMGARHVWRMV
jgi:hypothetical protein